MKNNVTAEKKIRTRKNTIVLLIGFLTPVVLFGSLAVSIINSGSSDDAVKTTKEYAVKNEYQTEETSVTQTVYQFTNDGNEEDLSMFFDKDDIRFGDVILPNLGR
jgi:uncharacterized protein YxeA